MTITRITAEQELHKIIEFLKDEEKINKRFQEAISQEYDSVYITECDGSIAGILIIQKRNSLSVVPTIYVPKSKQNQGIGTELLLFADKILQESPYEYAECECEINDSTASFLEKRGYIRSYTVIRMERGIDLISPEELSEQSLTEKGIVIRNYRDEDYLAYHNIVGVGFYLMRKKACSINWYDLPSVKERTLLAQNCSCRYVLTHHDEIVAIAKIFDNEIALLGVRPDKQMHGYGTLMLSYFINKIVTEGQIDKVTLGVLKDNPAHKLYLKMGFQEVSRKYNYVKFYKPDSRVKAPIGYSDEKEIMKAFRLHGMLQEEMVP